MTDTEADTVDEDGIEINVDNRRETWGMMIHLLNQISQRQQETNALLKQLVEGQED